MNPFLREKSVPIYFFISGYVFFYNVDFNKSAYIRKLKNRIKTLLIPYIVWNTIAIARILLCYLPCLSSINPNKGYAPNLSILNILSCYWDNNPGIVPVYQHYLPVDGPLWFLRDLIIIVVCTPVLYCVIKRYRHLPILFFGAIWMYASIGRTSDSLTRTYSCILFFSWGAYISILKINMLEAFNKHFNSSMILYPTSCILGMFSLYYFSQYYNLIHSLSVIIGMYFAYNLSSWLLRNDICKVNKFLAASSFFIYVSHALIIKVFLRFNLLILRPTSDLMYTTTYFLTALISIFFLLFVFYLLQRFAPQVLKIFIGRK